MSYQLRESANAIADVDGRAVAQLQPLRAFERWKIIKITVQSTSAPSVPECRIYFGAESESNFIEGTYSGNNDSTDVTLELENGERLIAVWSGAEPDSSCTLTLKGTSHRGI